MGEHDVAVVLIAVVGGIEGELAGGAGPDLVGDGSRVGDEHDGIDDVLSGADLDRGLIAVVFEVLNLDGARDAFEGDLAAAVPDTDAVAARDEEREVDPGQLRLGPLGGGADGDDGAAVLFDGAAAHRDGLLGVFTDELIYVPGDPLLDDGLDLGEGGIDDDPDVAVEVLDVDGDRGARFDADLLLGGVDLA